MSGTERKRPRLEKPQCTGESTGVVSEVHADNEAFTPTPAPTLGASLAVPVVPDLEELLHAVTSECQPPLALELPSFCSSLANVLPDHPVSPMQEQCTETYVPSEPICSGESLVSFPPSFEPAAIPALPCTSYIESTPDVEAHVAAPDTRHDIKPPLEPDPQQAPQLDLNYLLSQMFVDDQNKEFELECSPLGVPFENVDEPNLPLYPGASITLHQSFVSILTMALSFKLSGVCLDAILSLISLHLPKNNNFKSSLAFFKNYFGHLQSTKEFIYFCSECLARCNKEGCANHVNAKLCSLIKLPLIEQLQRLLKKEGFYSKLKFDNSDFSADKFSDICDGSVYREQVQKKCLGKEGNLSLNWYTDGVALYESSQTSVWPFFLTINELPYKDRNRKENLLLPMLWCGPAKPASNILVAELYPDLKKLSEGISLEVCNIGEKVITGCLISGTGDTPARSMMLNIVQFNGASSCQRCEQPGEPRADNPGVRIFPYKPIEMLPRSVDRLVQFGQMATRRKPCNGVKGPPPLRYIMPDCIRGLSIDPMHQVFGGVSKKVLHLLTQSPKEKKYSIINKVDTIDERLLGIRPPAHVSRVPRPLSHLGYYKMKEHKAFLLDYSLPCLKDLVPSNYLKHHGTLVAGIQYLNANVVTSEAKSTGKTLLHKYVSQFADFYEEKFLTINFHLLLHLAEVVQDLGPLWVHTCFAMESVNGEILSLVHGTRWAETQIATSVQTCLGHAELVQNLEESTSKQFCEKVLNRNELKTVAVVGRSKIMGRSEQVKMFPEELSNILHLDSKVEELQGLKVGIFLYVSQSKRNKFESQRDSTAAAFFQDQHEEIGLITHIYRKFVCACPSACVCDSVILVILKKYELCASFETLVPGVTVPNVAEYKCTNEIVVVNAEKLNGTCTKICVGDKLFISKPCNSREIE